MLTNTLHTIQIVLVVDILQFTIKFDKIIHRKNRVENK